METRITIIEKEHGSFLGVAGGNYRVVIAGEQTDNKYAVIEMIVPPGGGPPPHSHPLVQETFYVLEGEIEFKTENGRSTVKQGGFVNIPLGGAIHCFRNMSQTPVTLLCTVMPAGLEKLFEKIGSPAKPGQFLPVPGLTEAREALLKQLDEENHQKTYPMGYLD